MKGKRGKSVATVPELANQPAVSSGPHLPFKKGGKVHKASGGCAMPRADKKKRGGGIHIKKENKGLLHKETGTPEGEKIPESKIKAAEHSPDPAKRKRAVFAENAKHWNHGKK